MEETRTEKSRRIRASFTFGVKGYSSKMTAEVWLLIYPVMGFRRQLVMLKLSTKPQGSKETTKIK